MLEDLHVATVYFCFIYLIFSAFHYLKLEIFVEF